MATLEELVVRIKADASQLERELKQVAGVTQKQADKMTGAVGLLKRELMSLVPALSVAGFVAFGKGAIDAAGHITDLAARIGFAASTLSALEGPLKTSGSNLDEFAAAINRMNNMIGEAAKGTNQEAVKAFDQLGLSVRKLQEMSPEEQFYEISQAIYELGTQAKITEAGTNIFSKTFAAMQPTLKEHNGNMREAARAAKELHDAVGDETLNRIDAFGDALTKAALDARNEFLKLFGVMLRVIDLIPSGKQAGAAAREMLGLGPKPGVSAEEQKALDDFFRSQGVVVPGDQPFGPPIPSARGSNAGLLKPDKQIESATHAYRDYIKAIEDENYLLHINERERAGVKALMDAQNLAMKAHIEISDEDREKIIGMTTANEELRRSMEESARFSQELKDKFSGALTDIVFSFDSATDAAKHFAEQIARMIVEKRITGPLADALVGTSSGGTGILDDLFGGIGGIFGFAEGGRPPVGRPSIVGERGPEIFVPDSAGTVYPSGTSMGGVSVTNVFHISPGIQGTVQAELNRAIPGIINASVIAVKAGVEKGGRDAQIFGKRS